MRIQGAVFAAMMLSAMPAMAQEVEINLGHTHSEQGTYQFIAQKFQDLLKEDVGDRVKVNIFANASLGGEIAMIQGARTGAVDGMIVSQPAAENTVAEFKVLSLPYLFNDWEEATAILNGEIGASMLEPLEKYGLLGYAWGGVYERNVASTRPINSIDDMKGFKVRVIQSQGYVKAYEALGSQPTAMAYGELFLALENRVVDGAELATDQTLTDSFAEVTKHYANTRVHFIPTLFLFSKVKLDAMPDDIRAAIEKATIGASEYASTFVRQENDAAAQKLADAGVTFTNPDLAPFMEAARGTWDSILAGDEFGKDIVAKIEAFRN